MKRKRAPGAGRKPKAGPTSPLTFRIPDDLRSQLESEARDRGVFVAERLLWHLRRSINRERDESRDAATRAFCFLVAELADKIRWPEPQQPWHRNPFLFRAFKLGVAKILNEFEPAGEIRQPRALDAYSEEMQKRLVSPGERHLVKFAESMRKRWKSPASAGATAADEILSDFFRGPANSPDEVRQMWTDIGSTEPDMGPLAKQYFMQSDRTWYGMEQARKTLGIAEPKPETTKPKDKRK